MSLISLDEAARRTGLSVWTWRKWISRRAVPSIRLGRRRLVDEADVERLVACGRVEADARFALDAWTGGTCRPPRYSPVAAPGRRRAR